MKGKRRHNTHQMPSLAWTVLTKGVGKKCGVFSSASWMFSSSPVSALRNKGKTINQLHGNYSTTGSVAIACVKQEKSRPTFESKKAQ